MQSIANVILVTQRRRRDILIAIAKYINKLLKSFTHIPIAVYVAYITNYISTAVKSLNFFHAVCMRNYDRQTSAVGTIAPPCTRDYRYRRF